MSQEHRAESRKVHELDERTQSMESLIEELGANLEIERRKAEVDRARTNRLCSLFIGIGFVIAFGAFAFDFIAPLFQVRIAEGMGWQQLLALIGGVVMVFIGLITKGKR